MLHYLFDYLDKLNVPGAGVFNYISFRSAAAVITSLIISMLIGKKIIYLLQKKQVGEVVRDLGLAEQYQKKGTPSMGGVIILASIIIPVLLFARLNNIYVLLMLLTTVWLGLIGFVDDYIKIFKKNKEGLAARFKIAGQIVLGLIIGLALFLCDDVMTVEKVSISDLSMREKIEMLDPEAPVFDQEQISIEKKSTKTTIPFVKNNEFDYSWLVAFISEDHRQPMTWLVFVAIVIFILTAVSNGANLTDGLDGLATGVSAIIGTALGILAYVSSNVIYSDYLNIMFIPHSEELVIYAASFIGATVGFLWYNSYPAQVFMGDTGSLALGGIIAVFAIIIRKELLIPVLCGIFLAENLSVVLQIAWFKRTKRKYGAGRRIFLMAPLHHHYQKKGYPEPKIVTRFWIIALILAVISIVTLKIR
ncbi:MAG TPA: phospho-N-acetylmuramoyl-pentapeptide-transferase [Bacteroidales bacterium]|jgi:phospho-N-acetylmuramoyl-pentapeptide-transferase|nr:phospho-N-acetylmuramoyl-pentapeptide-transferase [Bacteroidales bacterium]OQB62774.1 MAG: Phospho-N-acetylmuramoyl-pentapeptide-transferase [Bacteroidetes bacterium ADurb.Bin145]NMD03522.1 phospho-N-acetylmuramoyl-pentapeptide-transferase [Bacteroidales bacterium]HOU01962.1 phospho-N-acetylmuramoyl-pentapeptide-transferase [Bacteroidales bacterium]HQG62343.1 phospho-N-acetylmuramoyl-pentapeptide-transferase [Bacteroidales bacterium]